MDSVAGPSQPRRSSSSSLSDHPPRRHSHDDDDDDDDLIAHPGPLDAPLQYRDASKGDSVRDTLLGRNRDTGGTLRKDPRDEHGEDGISMLNGDEGTKRETGMEEGARLASIEQKRALWWRNVFITGTFIASWYGFATLLSLYNKWMFTPEYYNFPFPLFATTCHMVVQFCLAFMIRKVWAKRFRPPERPSRQDYVSKVLPAAVSTGGDIGLSNMSLKIITLSLYTMAKSSALLFVLLFAFLFHIEKYSLRLMSVILFISFGVFLMVFNTTSVSVPGLVMVFSASALAGLRWALTELVMHKKSMGLSNPFATIFWLVPLMALVIAPASMLSEGWFNVFASEHLQGFKAVKTIGVIILPGVIAFAMVSSEYFIIHRAGSVPLSIAGIFKEVTTITVSALVFGDQLTELNIIGVVITVCGIALYTYHKYQKSISTPIPLDPQGRPVEQQDSPISPVYTRARSHPENIRTVSAQSPSLYMDGIQLNSLDPSGRDHRLADPEQTNEDRANRLRDDFEGWNRRVDEWSDEEVHEVGDEEVAARMEERVSSKSSRGKSWGDWWEKEM